MTGKKQFDETEVLAQISDYFWEHGYGATRVDQLSALTGLTKTSLYNAFGNKESLFLKSLDFYVEQGLNLRMRQIDPSRPLSENLQLILESAFLRKNNEKLSYGCLLTNSILELAGSEPRLQEEASKRYDQSCVAIRQVFALYVDTKRLVPDIEVDDLTLSNLSTAGDSVDATSIPRVYEPMSLADVERRHVLATLQATGWNKSRTASILGIERSTLDRKIRRYELSERASTPGT